MRAPGAERAPAERGHGVCPKLALGRPASSQPCISPQRPQLHPATYCRHSGPVFWPCPASTEVPTLSPCQGEPRLATQPSLTVYFQNITWQWNFLWYMLPLLLFFYYIRSRVQYSHLRYFIRINCKRAVLCNSQNSQLVTICLSTYLSANWDSIVKVNRRWALTFIVKSSVH